MSKFVDVYLLPIAEENVAAYKKLANAAGKVFVKNGALRYREYVLDDPESQGLVPFPKNVKVKPGETVIYGVVEFKSKAHRDSTMKKIMADPELQPPPGTKPLFNYKRMVYGGFKILVDH